MLLNPPYAHVMLMQEIAAYNRTSRNEREIADMLKEADFARHAELAARPPQPRRRLSLRALFRRRLGQASAGA